MLKESTGLIGYENSPEGLSSETHAIADLVNGFSWPANRDPDIVEARLDPMGESVLVRRRLHEKDMASIYSPGIKLTGAPDESMYSYFQMGASLTSSSQIDSYEILDMLARYATPDPFELRTGHEDDAREFSFDSAGQGLGQAVGPWHLVRPGYSVVYTTPQRSYAIDSMTERIFVYSPLGCDFLPTALPSDDRLAEAQSTSDSPFFQMGTSSTFHRWAYPAEHPDTDFLEALIDLNSVQAMAQEDGGVIPGHNAVKRAGRVLGAMYRISPRSYAVYPLPDGEIVIDAATRYGTSLVVLCNPDGSAQCLTYLGNEYCPKDYAHTGMIPDEFILRALLESRPDADS